MAMIDDVRLALRITTTKYDAELTSLMNAALADLSVAGVVYPTQDPYSDALIKMAVTTYIRMNFGSPADYDRLLFSYKEQKAQLSTNTGHTDWGV